MQKLSLFQRFKADTPKFERGLQLLAVVCAALLAYASKLGYVPPTLFDVLSGAFGGVALVSQFAYEHDAEIKALIADPSQALSMIPQLHDQVANLADAIKNQPPPTLSSVEQLVDQLKPIPDYTNGGIVQGAPAAQKPVAQGLDAWPQAQPGADQQNQNSDPGTQNQ